MKILLAAASTHLRDDVRGCLARWTGISVVETDGPEVLAAQRTVGGFGLIIAGPDEREEEWRRELQQVRLRDRMTPIILIVPRSRPEWAIAGIRSGVSDYLLSPFTCRGLHHRLAKWLGPTMLPLPQPVTARSLGSRNSQAAPI